MITQGGEARPWIGLTTLEKILQTETLFLAMLKISLKTALQSIFWIHLSNSLN